MKKQLMPLFWIEALLASGNAVVLVLTILRKEWIESVFNIQPDAGSGALEWTIVTVTVVLTAVFLALSRREWQRYALRSS